MAIRREDRAVERESFKPSGRQRAGSSLPSFLPSFFPSSLPALRLANLVSRKKVLSCFFPISSYIPPPLSSLSPPNVYLSNSLTHPTGPPKVSLTFSRQPLETGFKFISPPMGKNTVDDLPETKTEVGILRA